MGKIYRTPSDLEDAEIHRLYDEFDAPVTDLDCGRLCAPDNPSGKPFCCDICHAVPAAYRSEWTCLEKNTRLWHAWHGDECQDGQAGHPDLIAETPDSMTLLACLGPQQCERQFRLLSCRQFPFFPYITSDYRFLGLAYEWAFEETCWVIRNPNRVTETYRRQFVATFDRLFALFDEEFENYAAHSAGMRAVFSSRRRRIPILHRDGGQVLVSPGSEKVRKIVSLPG
jgi:hypothetical protein